jgi:hypothetical protein
MREPILPSSFNWVAYLCRYSRCVVFFCDVPHCKRKTFTQQVPSFLPTYARWTSRLASLQRSISLTAGGEAGARMTSKLQLPTSPDTLLRLIRNSQEVRVTSLKAVGINDWAIRKCKTFLCGMSRQRKAVFVRKSTFHTGYRETQPLLLPRSLYRGATA